MKQFYYVLFLVLCLNLGGCITYKKVDIKGIQSVELKEISNGEARVSIVLGVNNPNNYNIKIKKYNLTSYINGKEMGKVDVENKIVVQKNSDQNYPINIKADVSKLMSYLPGLMFGGSIELGLKGTIKFSAKGFGKKYPIDLKQKVNTKDLKLF